MWKYSSLASLRHSDASHSGWGCSLSVSLPRGERHLSGHSAPGQRAAERQTAAMAPRQTHGCGKSTRVVSGLYGNRPESSAACIVP